MLDARLGFFTFLAVISTELGNRSRIIDNICRYQWYELCATALDEFQGLLLKIASAPRGPLYRRLTKTSECLALYTVGKLSPV